MNAKNIAPLPETSSKQGSTLTVVLIIMMLTSFMAASLLTLGGHEKDFTYRRIADVEGRHVLESAVEIAMAELQQHFREAQSVDDKDFSVNLSSALTSKLINNTRYITGVRITNIANVQYKKPIFVDAQDPDTVLDPHRGSYVRVSEWVIQAEADLNYRGQTRQMQAAQSFQVRESPFFTHAILYNMDLEFHPGPAMTINGPVHSNGRIWALAWQSLHFLDRVTATEGIHIGSMLAGNQTDWSSGPSSGQSGRKVWFNTNGRKPGPAEKNEAHDRNFANLYGNGGERTAAAYYDSRSEATGKLFSDLGFTGMGEFFANWFDGNLASGSLEAPLIRSQFIPNYVADDGNGNRLNFGYALIEPLMSPLASDGTKNSFHKGNGEREKFSFKSGLSFEVRYLPEFDTSTLTEDQNHWRQLWEPGVTPVQRPRYSQTFNSFVEGGLDGQKGFSVTGSNKSDVEIQNHPHLPEYTDDYFLHNISEQFILLKPGGNQDSGYVYTKIPTLNQDTIYFSLLLDAQSANSNTEFQLGLTNEDDFSTLPDGSFPGVSVIASPESGQNIGILSEIGTNLLTDKDPTGKFVTGKNQTLLIVLRVKKGANGEYDRLSLYVNTTSLTYPGETSDWKTSAIFNSGLEELNHLFLRSKGNSYRVTDIRIGTEYRQVVGKRAGVTDYWLIPQKVRRSNAFDLDTTDFTPSASIPLLNEDGDPLTDADGNEMSTTILGVAHDPVYIHEDYFHDVFRARIYEEDANGHPLPNGGFYDKRELKPQDLVSMDMEAFKTEIMETTDLERFRKPLVDGGTFLTYTPSIEFNGVTYFQFPIPVPLPSRPDNIIVALDSFREVSTKNVDGQSWVARENETTSLSLHIHNAKQIPNPDYNSNRSPGFTLATNSRLYIHGSYNADGVYSTGSPTSSDGEGAGYKTLAALAADSLTFLSDNFKFESSKRNFDNIPGTVFTEVNAALMGGIVPTNTTDYDTSRYVPMSSIILSGGSHNFHRFLERWDKGNNNNNKTFRYRGSMVSFYESELSRSFMGQERGRTQGYDWYEAPRREYGFYDEFGLGKQPPGTPMARTYFKMDFRFE